MGFVRLLLALSVVCDHAGFSYALMGGQAAVQIFYLISGFLIAHILDGRYPSRTAFYASRALRIYPAYLVVAAAMLALRLGEGERLAEFHALNASAQLALIVSNIGVIGQDWIMFLAEKGRGLAFTTNFRTTDPQLWTFLLLPQAWTLGLELSFYAVAPFIAGRRRILSAIILLSVGARIMAAGYGLDDDPWTYRFFPFEAGIFALGMLSHDLLYPRLGEARRWALPAAIAIIAAQPILHLPVAALIAAFALMLPHLFQLRGHADFRAGELSYPLYLIHWPVLLVSQHMLGATAAAGALTIVGSLMAAEGLRLIVAAPMDRLRHRLRHADTAPNVFHAPPTSTQPSVPPAAGVASMTRMPSG